MKLMLKVATTKHRRPAARNLLGIAWTCEVEMVELEERIGS